MSKCVMKGCPNSHRRARRTGQKISFFTFPKNTEIAKKWRQIAGIETVPSRWARICSVHFGPESYKPLTWVQQQLDYIPTSCRRLHDNAIPSKTPLSEEVAVVSRSRSSKTPDMEVLQDEEASVSKIELDESSDARVRSERTDEEIFPEPSIETDVEIDHEDLVNKYIKEKKKVILWKTLCEIYKERAEFAEKQLQEIWDLSKR